MITQARSAPLGSHCGRLKDPAFGASSSPDTTVPNAASAIDDNRYLHASPGPFNGVYPTGLEHCGLPSAVWAQALKDGHDGRDPNGIGQYGRTVSLWIPGSGLGGYCNKMNWITYTDTWIVGQSVPEGTPNP